MKLLILNGPNLNLLGQREPDVYGHASLEDLERELSEAYPRVQFQFYQSNYEGTLIDRLHQAHHDRLDGVVFNPGGFAHTSIALRDAVAGIAVPVVEVHLSNVHAREPFRHTTYTGAACAGVMTGFGMVGYHLAVDYFFKRASVDASRPGGR